MRRRLIRGTSLTRWLPLLALLPLGASAADIETLEARLTALEATVEALRAEIAEKRTAAEAVPAVDVEETASRPQEPMSWGVELEFELVDTEADAATDEPDAHFQVDQLYLYPKLRLTGDAWFSADIAVKGSTTYIEEAWFRWTPRGSFWLQAGLDDAWIAKIDRKSEAEILLETAFYRSDALGLQIGGAIAPRLEWWGSVTDGFGLTTHGPSEDDAYPLIHDGRRLGGYWRRTVLLGAGIRFTGKLGDAQASVMPFAYRGGLNRADVAFLQSIAGYGIANDDEKSRWGATIGWQQGSLTLLAQGIEARDGALDRRGFFVQPSWRLNDFHEFVYRYNRLQVGLAPERSDSRTWDRTQHVFALISTLSEGVRLKSEYYVNGERTGGASVDNDEFLLQLEVVLEP